MHRLTLEHISQWHPKSRQIELVCRILYYVQDKFFTNLTNYFISPMGLGSRMSLRLTDWSGQTDKRTKYEYWTHSQPESWLTVSIFIISVMGKIPIVKVWTQPLVPLSLSTIYSHHGSTVQNSVKLLLSQFSEPDFCVSRRDFLRTDFIKFSSLSRPKFSSLGSFLKQFQSHGALYEK